MAINLFIASQTKLYPKRPYTVNGFFLMLTPNTTIRLQVFFY